MFCVLCAASLIKAQTIKQSEYFIDKDKGVGKNSKLTLGASGDSSYTFTADVSNFAAGYHKLYVRTKDSKGKWSITVQKNFEVVTADTQAVVISGEYFYDTDPGFDKGKKINVSPKDSLVMQDFNTVTSSLGKGYHKLYTRFKDSYGKWSITIQRNIGIIKTTDTVKIIAAEYFFDDDKGYRKATEKIFASASDDSAFKFKIPYNKIPADADTLFIRAEDSLGNWSLTKYALFSVQSVLKQAVADNAAVNEADEKQLQVFPNPASNIINYSYKGVKNITNAVIVNANGETVKRFQLSNTQGKLNIGNLVAGTYILQISNSVQTQSVKFIKQ